MPLSRSPFDDIRALFAQLPSASDSAVAAVRARNAALAKPVGSLGRLEESVEWLAAWQDRETPRLDKPFAVVFAGSHGVAEQGVSGDSPQAARQKLELSAAGGAAVNQIAATYGIGLKVFELALDHPVNDITQDAALDEKSAAATFAFGMEAIAGEPDLLCLGAFGRAADVPAAAILSALLGGVAGDWILRRTGERESLFARKIDAVQRALALHATHLSDPLELMRRLGGREHCALAGAIIAARLQRVPVVLDGHGAAAAAAVLQKIDATALDHCFAAQPVHCAGGDVFAALGMTVLFDMGVASGDGAGAALAAGVLKAAAACHSEMATWEQAGIGEPHLI